MTEKSHWLVKSEPDAYSWDDLVAEKEGTWDGVKNAQASNNMKAMKVGDEAFFYHSRQGLEIVGIVTITQEQFPDPFDDTGRWIAVKVKPVRKLKRAVSLKEMKANPELSELAIIRQSRLSVAPVTTAQWSEILKLSEQ